MKKIIARIIVCFILSTCIVGCSKADKGEITTDTTSEQVQEQASEQMQEQVYIVYTNDMHSYIYNTVKDENGEEHSGLRMSNIAAMVKDMKAEGKNVLLVDAGDSLQGDVYGAFDEGESVIKLMNACSYQLAAPGNHDFDYGMGTFFNRMEEANYPYISCNFHALEGDGDPLKASHVFDIAGKKIAFIGITTPETITSSTPIYFQNEKGEYIYIIDGEEDPSDMYKSVQKAIDDVRNDVDYVIALAHVGVGIDEKKDGISSYDVIKNTEGLDAYIDAHSHTLIEGEKIKDKSGKDVLLTQTGSYLSNVGVMEISDGTITTSFVDSYDKADDTVASIENEINSNLIELMGEKIAVLDTPLYINDPDKPERRVIRSQEMNLGDLTSDSIYWYFNDVIGMNCDIAFTNGGGIRAQLEKGDITYMDAKSIEPFGNMICLIEASGQEILDALEMGVTVIGEWDEDWDAPAESGGFMQVAGMQYTIDTSVPTSVKTSADGMFISIDGEYRVKDVKIYNKETDLYEDLDLNKTYTVGGINYLLRNNGNGLNMFSDDPLVVDFVGQDYVILSIYLSNFKKDGDYPLIRSENSPLYDLTGYQLDYENPFGAGRINIIIE